RSWLILREIGNELGRITNVQPTCVENRRVEFRAIQIDPPRAIHRVVDSSKLPGAARLDEHAATAIASAECPFFGQALTIEVVIDQTAQSRATIHQAGHDVRTPRLHAVERAPAPAFQFRELARSLSIARGTGLSRKNRIAALGSSTEYDQRLADFSAIH